MDFLDELLWRGLLKDCTDEQRLRDHLASGARRAYCGFDPTADSLTIGNLVPIMLLVHFARAGHEPVVVMGGGTGLIGDPSGKSAERQLMTGETVQQNVDAQRPIFERVFAGAGQPAPMIRNNLDWLGKVSYLEALRDIGKHFSVNMMIQKDSVKARLTERDQGISYTEFSYMILQSYDFLKLYQDEGVTIQLGGSDQWGNIVGGADLIRRVETDDAKSFGMTAPLVTKADGGKFGKTETGAVWLTPERTSSYAYYQFWLNAADADVFNFLRTFTLHTKDEIEALEAAHQEAPGKREPHRALARAATELLHGREQMELAEKAGKALFSGELADLPEGTLREVFAEVPSSEHERSSLDEGLDPVALLVSTGLAKSNREAREFLGNGSVSVNGTKIDAETTLDASRLLHGSLMAIRRGKKSWHLTRWA
ncbi:MAG: tyrosine--tRNA ligase [Planctomycetota bacterium]